MNKEKEFPKTLFLMNCQSKVFEVYIRLIVHCHMFRGKLLKKLFFDVS